jgi:hypothetical protein
MDVTRNAPSRSISMRLLTDAASFSSHQTVPSCQKVPSVRKTPSTIESSEAGAGFGHRQQVDTP